MKNADHANYVVIKFILSLLITLFSIIAIILTIINNFGVLILILYSICVSFYCRNTYYLYKKMRAQTESKRHLFRVKDLLLSLQDKTMFIWIKCNGKEINPQDIFKYRNYYVYNIYPKIDEMNDIGLVIEIAEKMAIKYTSISKNKK